MAPSYNCKCVMIALLVVFSMAVAKPCAAIRAEGAEATSKQPHAAVVAAPAPSPPVDASRRQMQLASFLMPDFPCGLPFLPQILVDLCHAIFSVFTPPTPPPLPEDRSQFRSPLTKRFLPSCGAFLTDSSVPAPSRDCCKGIHSFFNDGSTTPFCLCHVANGDINELLPEHVTNLTRGVDVLVACHINFSAQEITETCEKDSPGYGKHACM
jgi:hypothetical protein